MQALTTRFLGELFQMINFFFRLRQSTVNNGCVELGNIKASSADESYILQKKQTLNISIFERQYLFDDKSRL